MLVGMQNLFQMNGSIEESALVCQGRNGYIMLGARGSQRFGAAQDDMACKERKTEEA
jgi:hypothetical protein